MNTYVLGAVKPNVKQAANDAGNLYGITTILGVGMRDGQSDHPKGLALDFMVPGNSAQGDQVAQYFLTNAGKYGVHYIIWKQRIWNVTERNAEGWRNMPDRGGVTANHYDHVHVSFNNVAVNNNAAGVDPTAAGGIPNPIDAAKQAIDAVKKINDFMDFMSNPHMWLRVAMFLAGGQLILLSLIIMASGNPSVKTAANVAVKAVTKSKKPSKSNITYYKVDKYGGMKKAPKLD